MDNYNKAIITISESNTAYLEGLHTYSMYETTQLKDDLLYVQWKNYLDAGDPDAEYLFSRLSEGLQKDMQVYMDEAKKEGENTTEETDGENTTEEAVDENTTEETEGENTSEEAVDENTESAEEKEILEREQEIEAIFEESDKSYEEVEKLIADAQIANTNGDDFSFVTVLFTIVLFFGGMSAISQRPNLKVVYIVVATIMFIYSLVKFLGIPFPSA